MSTYDTTAYLQDCEDQYEKRHNLSAETRANLMQPKNGRRHSRAHTNGTNHGLADGALHSNRRGCRSSGLGLVGPLIDRPPRLVPARWGRVHSHDTSLPGKARVVGHRTDCLDVSGYRNCYASKSYRFDFRSSISHRTRFRLVPNTTGPTFIRTLTLAVFVSLIYY